MADDKKTTTELKEVKRGICQMEYANAATMERRLADIRSKLVKNPAFLELKVSAGDLDWGYVAGEPMLHVKTTKNKNLTSEERDLIQAAIAALGFNVWS